MSEAKLIEQLKAAQQLKKLPLAKLISLFESTLPQHGEDRLFLSKYIHQRKRNSAQPVVSMPRNGLAFSGTSSSVSASPASGMIRARSRLLKAS